MPRATKLVTVHAMIPAPLRERITHDARKEGMSISTYIRRVLMNSHAINTYATELLKQQKGDKPT